jgi:WhiB family redox-sensing transcriptional regulator
LDEWLDATGQYTEDTDTERWVSYSISDLYPDWQKKAHCAGVGVGYYFGEESEQPTMSIRQVRSASKLCEVCPVYIECLTHALTVREEYGVWAGTSGRVRRRIFKMMDTGLTTVAEVVERFRSGHGDDYRLGRAGSTAQEALGSPITHVTRIDRTFEWQGARLPARGGGHGRLRLCGAGVPAADAGEVAL